MNGLPIFIGGTGRSGTTILAKTLGKHRDIFAWPVETRIISDPDGIGDLEVHLVDRWDPFAADLGIKRFEQLLADLSHGRLGRYPTVQLERVTGRERLGSAAAFFLDQIRDFSFPGGWIGNVNLFQKALLTQGVVSRKRLRPFLPGMDYARPLSRSTFRNHAGKFLREILGGPARDRGKLHFVEHTPFNLLFADLLLGMFQDLRLIHVYRDTDDVVSSYRRQGWAPADVTQAQAVVTDLTQRVQEITAGFPKEHLLEMKFEDFALNTEQTLRRVVDFLGIPWDQNMLAVDLSRHNIGRATRDRPNGTSQG